MSVHLITGPPGSGKTTYAVEHMTRGDLLLDFDEVHAAITGEPQHEHVGELRDYVMRALWGPQNLVRDRAAEGDETPETWIVRGLPLADDRQRMADELDAEVVVVATPLDVCAARIDERDVSDDAKARMKTAARLWWQDYVSRDDDMVVSDTSRSHDQSSADDNPHSLRPRRAAVPTRVMPMLTEYRFNSGALEMRGLPGEGATVIAHAAVYDSETVVGGRFREVVTSSAFAKSLADGADVRAYINHDPNHLMGRTKAGTLRLASDDVGLLYEVDLPDRQDARDAYASIERGDMTGSSFAFETIHQDVQRTKGELPLRRLTEVRLYDVSMVSEPQYDAANDVAVERSIRSMRRAGVWDDETPEDRADDHVTEPPEDTAPAATTQEPAVEPSETLDATPVPEPEVPSGMPLYVARLALYERLGI